MTVPAEDPLGGFEDIGDFTQEPTPEGEVGVPDLPDTNFNVFEDVPDFEAPDSAQGEVVPPPSPAAAQGPLQLTARRIGQAPIEFLSNIWQDATTSISSAVLSVAAVPDAVNSYYHGDSPNEIERRLNRWKYIALTAQKFADLSPQGLQARLMGVEFAKKDPSFIASPQDLPGELQSLYTSDEAFMTSTMPIGQALMNAGAISPALQDMLKMSASNVANMYKKDVSQVTLGETLVYAYDQTQSDWFKVADKIKDPVAIGLNRAAIGTPIPPIPEELIKREMTYGVFNPVTMMGAGTTTMMDLGATDPTLPAGEILAASKVLRPFTKLLWKVDTAMRSFSAGRKFSPEEAALALNLLDFEEFARSHPGLASGTLPRGIETEFELVALKGFRERLIALAKRSGLTYEDFKESLRSRSGQFEKFGPAGNIPPKKPPTAPPDPERVIITPPPKGPPPEAPVEPQLLKPVGEVEPPESGIGEIISRGRELEAAARKREVDLIRKAIQETGEPPPAGSFSFEARAEAGILSRRDFAEYMGSLRQGLREAGSDYQKISGIGDSIRETSDLLASTGHENWAKELASLEKEVLKSFEDSWKRAAAEAELEMDAPLPITDTGKGVIAGDMVGPEPEIPPRTLDEELTLRGLPPQTGRPTLGQVLRSEEGSLKGRPKTRQQTEKQKIKQAIKEGTAGKKALTQPEVQELSKRVAFTRNMLNAMPPGMERDQVELEINIMNQALQNRGKVPASLRRAVDEILAKQRRGPLEGPGAASAEEFRRLNEEYRLYLAEKFHRSEQLIREGETPLYHHTPSRKAMGTIQYNVDPEGTRVVGGEKVKEKVYGGIREEGIKGPVSFTRTDLSNVPLKAQEHPQMFPESLVGKSMLGQFIRDPQPFYFGREELPVRLVTTREELMRHGIKVTPSGEWKLAAEEVAASTVPPSAILKVEIDPSAFGHQLDDPDTVPDILAAIKVWEDQGVPVVIRPLFQQTGVHEFRPILPPVVERSLNKALAGADEATNISMGMAKVARETNTVEEAAIALRNLKTSLDNRTGGAVKDAGINLKGKTPEKAGEELLDAQVPGLTPSGKDFLPRFPVQEVIDDPGRLLPAPNPMASMGPDATAFSMLTATPSFVLDDRRNPIAYGIYRMQRWGRYLSDNKMEEYVGEMRDVADIVRRSPDKEKQSERLFDAINIRDEAEALKGLSVEEKAAVLKARRYINNWVNRNAEKFFEINNPNFNPRKITPEEIAAFDNWRKGGLLEKAGFLAWGPDDFFAKNMADQLKATEIPPELMGEVLSGNPMLSRALPGLQSHKDLMASLRVLGPGVIRNDVWRPIWKDMANSAKFLPPNMATYVGEWIKAQRGVKSRLHQIIGGAERTGRFKLHGTVITPADEVAGMLLTGFYRGALYGNVGYYLANFLGQGVANTYALQGPFAPFTGIARHFKRSFDGVTREQLLGGFDTVLGRDIPKTPLADELSRIPGMKQVRKFLDWVEQTSGPTQSEFINRSIGMHVGLQQALDNYNARNGMNLNYLQVLNGEVGEGVRDRLMYEALEVSDRVNFLYGMDGSNPIIRNTVGRNTVALVGQFLSYFPKQTEFFLRGIKQNDPGVIIRYLTASGWMAGLAAKGWGIDLSSTFFFGSVPRTREGVPLPVGPAPQALILLMRGIAEEDANKRDRYSNEFWRTISLLAHPGALQRQKTEHFFRQLRAGRLLAPGGPPWETIASWGTEPLEQHGPIFGPNGRVDWTHTQIENEVAKILASETPARFLGLPTLSDRQERLIYKTANRIQSEWRRRAKRNVEGLLAEIQEGRTLDSPKSRELIAKLEEDGMPVEGMIKEGIFKSSLPRMYRFFEDQSMVYKYDFYEYLKALYPEVFETPSVMPYNMFGPSPEQGPQNPSDPIGYWDWQDGFTDQGEQTLQGEMDFEEVEE